ncbi:MAG: hypothetical protein ABSC55_15150 [Syntrophorhabdales bacterium]
MKLLLVAPSNKLGRKVLKAIRMPQLGLHILASLTPDDVDITVMDEQIKEIKKVPKSFSAEFIPPSYRKKPYGTPMPWSSERQKAAGQTSSPISERINSGDSTMSPPLISQSTLHHGEIFRLTRRSLIVWG